jgi:hypothetical protein
MGTYDISRINFDKTKHYSSVRMQQGRVLTDDDWNENARIENEIQRVSNTEIVGPFGSPDDGFKIANLRLESGLVNFDILSGTLYLGGLRLELETGETYRLQKDWLQKPALSDGTPNFNELERYDLVYLESWQQPVSAVEDSSLFEVALGGPDTTTRVRNMRRVHLATGIGFCSCTDAWDKLKTDWKAAFLGKINEEYERITDTLLKVSFNNSGLPEDLCTPAAAGGYLGAENQAIRVQLVDNNHFTWGFDNASPLYRVAVSANGKTVKMLTEPKDQYHWPLSNQVVEILPWSAVLPNGEKVAEQMGHLTKVEASYNPDTGEFTLQDVLAPTFGSDWKSRADKNDLDNQVPPEYFYLRVWNRGDDFGSGSKISFTTGTPVLLGHTGLEITITGNDRTAGDYWVIAARPETPNRVVPWELEKGLSPHGVRRYFAPLAVLKWKHETVTAGNVTGKIIHDCRKKFHPLTEQECCCTFTVGDGKRSNGDFSSIQDAVDNLPADGGKICVLPGEHIANVEIMNKRQIRITGCGEHSIVRPKPDMLGNPVFLIQNAQKIQIDQLTIVAFDGIGIEVTDKDDSKIFSDQITIKENSILAGIHAIHVHVQEDKGGDNNIHIAYNKIGMIDKAIGKAAILSIADAVLIERNRIVVIASPEGNDPDDPSDPDDPQNGDPFNPCFDRLRAYLPGFSIRFQVFRFMRYILLYRPTGRSEKKYLAEGGIQIGGTSEKVSIRENEIIGGKGNGITLGHVHNDDNQYAFKQNNTSYKYSPLYEISIEENLILQMGLSGISCLLSNENGESYVVVNDIIIYRNTIKLCARQLPEINGQKTNKNRAWGGIVLSDCTNGSIQENIIQDNGQIEGAPICGIFVMHGETLNFSGNCIVNNGLPVLDEEVNIQRGHRGGIVVLSAFKVAALINIFKPTMPSFDGVPAVVVNDNVVVQPHGLALFIIAFGPVSVVSNQFTSLGTDKTNFVSLFASAVFILNLGISKDLLLFAFANMGNTVPDDNKKKLSNQSAIDALIALQYLPNGKVMFSSNQTTLDMRSPLSNLCLSSQFIASLDDVAYNTNQSECSSLLGVVDDKITFDFVLVNTVLFGVTVRSNDNRLSDGVTLTLFSLASLGFMITATGNQSTHCLLPIGLMKAVNSNLVFDNTFCKDSIADNFSNRN